MANQSFGRTADHRSDVCWCAYWYRSFHSRFGTCHYDHSIHRCDHARCVLVVPDLLKESAYGMGATTWEVVTKVVLPYTKAGVVGGLILGLGRALGETMAVTF